jgi:ATP-dependent 26S proteasome regulatory subunit
MDGLVALENVVVIRTSNRPDYIDPAILRPNESTAKSKIRRPDKKRGAPMIFSMICTTSFRWSPDLLKDISGDQRTGASGAYSSTPRNAGFAKRPKPNSSRFTRAAAASKRCTTKTCYRAR